MATAPPKPPKIEELSLSLLEPMPGNRAHESGMDKKSLTDLANSILAQGVMIPLICRPHPTKKNRFEIVAGVRRKTAAEQAALKTAPCIVRDLTDQQAKEIRIIENLQRVNVHEMEEARGYHELLELKDEQTGAPLHTIKSISETIGKSEAYVYARIKLLRMPDVAQEAFLGAKLNASIALLLCRIPDPKMAYKASLEVLDRHGSGITPEREKRAKDDECEPMSFRQAKEHIANHYMKRLKGAKFDQEDENLVPAVFEEVPLVEVKSTGKGDVEDHKTRADLRTPSSDLRLFGGKCSDCPFRTGNMKKTAPDLVKMCEGDSGGGADVCTNIACFKLKEKMAAKLETLKFKDKGQVLLTETQASKLLNYSGDSLNAKAQSQFINLREVAPGKKGKTWEEVLEPHLPEEAKPVVVRGKKNFLLLPVADALDAAHKAGVKIEKPKELEPEESWEEREEKRKKRHEFADTVIKAAYLELEAAVPKRKPEDLLRFVVASDFNRIVLPGLKVDRNDEKYEKEFAKFVEKMSLQELCIALAMNNFPDGCNHQGELREEFIDACKDFGVNIKVIVEAKGKEAKAAKSEPSEKSDKK